MALIVADADEHAWVYAGFKELSLADKRGNVFANTPCDLFQIDQVTAVPTYTDETRGVVVEQLKTDPEGNLGIWALPGVYRLRINFLSPPGATDWVQIEVPINSKELNVVSPNYDVGTAPAGYDALVTTVGTHTTQITSLQGSVVANTTALGTKLDKAAVDQYVTSVNGLTGNVTVDSTGAAVQDASSIQKGIIQLAGDLAGTADVPSVPGLANKAALTDFNAHVANDTDAHDIFRTSTLPAGTTQTDWTLSQKVFIDANGKMWVQKGSVIDPGTPAPPDPTLTEQVTIAEAHFEKAYVAANGAAVSGGTTTALACAKAMRNALLDRDKAKFDLILTFLETSMRRDKSGSGQTTFLRGYASAASSAGSVSSYTLDMGAEVMILGNLIGAWNLWNDTDYKDIGSWKAKLVVDMSVLDGTSRYLPHDELTTPANYLKIHLSDLDISVFRRAQVFTSDSKFNSLINGTVDLWQKATTTGGALPTTVAIPPAWLAYNTSSHAVSAITNGTNGWTITQPTDLNSDVDDAILFLLADNKKTPTTATTALLTSLKTFFANKWTTDSAIYTNYAHVDGTNIGTSETAQRYLTAHQVLTFNEVGNTAAASILSTKIQSMATDSNGKYFPNQIQGVTAAASRDAQANLGLINAMRAGIYLDLMIVGSNPSAGTTNPGGGGTIPPPTGTFKLYADPTSQLMGYANGLTAGTKKTRVTWVASLPQALWSGINWDPDPSTSGTKTYVDNAVAAGAVPLLLSYSIPLRDFGQFSSGGAANLAQYQDWITKFAIAVGNNKAAIVYEPDSLSQLENLPTDDARTGRIAAMTWGFAYLRQHCPNAWLYVDAGHPNWHDAGTMVTRIKSMHGEIGNGCALNISNFETTPACIAYGNDIASGMNAGSGWGYTIDIGRNGNPAPLVQFGTGDDWSNPPNRRIGGVPQWGGFTATPLLHGTAIWKRLGESDGSARGAPSAGSLYPQSVYNDSVGDNVDANSIAASSGYAQRPPTPGVVSPG